MQLQQNCKTVCRGLTYICYYGKIKNYRWYVIKQDDTSRFYITSHIKKNNKWTSLRLHKIIINGNIIDHKNHNGFDNRKENLRLCTHAENMRNRKYTQNNSGYKGVYFDKDRNKYRMSIKKDGKQYFGGRYDNIIKAAKAYNNKAKELFGEFAYLNQI